MTAAVKLENYDLGGEILDVPYLKCDEIHLQSSTDAQEREGLIHYFLNYSQYASWSGLASRLYYWENHEALSAARRFIKRAPGRCVYTHV